MRLAGLKVEFGYSKRRGSYDGKPALIAPNTLDRQFGPMGSVGFELATKGL